MSTTANRPLVTLKDWAKKNNRPIISHYIQTGKESGYLCIFATKADDANDSKTIMISKGLAEEVKKGDAVKPLWNNPITEGTGEKEGIIYLGRKQHDNIFDEE